MNKSTEDNLRDLLPDRDDIVSASAERVVDKVVSDTADNLVAKEVSKKTRELQRKAEQYKQRYGTPPIITNEGELQDSPWKDDTPKPRAKPYKPDPYKTSEIPTMTTEGIKLKKVDRVVSNKPTEVIPLVNAEEVQSRLPTELQQFNSTTPLHVQKLMKKLNIDQTVQLSRTDMYNLLSTLMVCNENQLLALRDNKKVPIVVRTIIKALLVDMRAGNLETVEKLWDRVFGKPTQVTENTTTAQVSALDSILPGVTGRPVSREAYVLIREQLLGDGK